MSFKIKENGKKSYYYRPSGTKQLVVNCFKW